VQVPTDVYDTYAGKASAIVVPLCMRVTFAVTPAQTNRVSAVASRNSYDALSTTPLFLALTVSFGSRNHTER